MALAMNALHKKKKLVTGRKSYQSIHCLLFSNKQIRQYS